MMLQGQIDNKHSFVPVYILQGFGNRHRQFVALVVREPREHGTAQFFAMQSEVIAVAVCWEYLCVVSCAIGAVFTIYVAITGAVVLQNINHVMRHKIKES